MSKGENKVVDILNGARVCFQREKTFYDLRRNSFRFDFYIENYNGKRVMIEVNGEQHYKYIPAFYKTQLEWRQSCGRDMRKISYCLANNIVLYLIPYWEIKNLQTIDDVLNEKFVAKTRFQNVLEYEKYLKSHK